MGSYQKLNCQTGAMSNQNLNVINLCESHCQVDQSVKKTHKNISCCYCPTPHVWM